jgi:propanol-preferring alcohol dehydrogenase
MCRRGLEQNCVNVKLSGFTVDGTFSEYVVSWVYHVTPIPDNLESAEAASILCAGVTVYRALKHSLTGAGEWVVVPGAGGGLGHLAIQYAKYMGKRVIAIDTGEEKKQLCTQLGADHWIDFKESKDIVKDIVDHTDGLGAHSTIVTAATGAAYSQAVDYLRPGGSLMAVGLPAKSTLDASIFFTVLKNINIIGSYVGNRQDAVEAMRIASTGGVKCHYVRKELSDMKTIYEGLKEGKVAGRIVIEYRK